MTTLVDRVASSAARKIAILGLTGGAGKATTLGHLIRGLQDSGLSVGVAAAGREEEDVEFTQTPHGTTVPVRKGTVVATTDSSQQRVSAKLEVLERTDIATPQGPVLIARVLEDGDVEPIGPASAHELRHVIDIVERQTAGRVLIEGSFNRRSFAAPGIADGIIVAVGAALAPEIERAVASTRYYVDLFAMRACEPRVAEIFPVAEAEGAAVMLAPDHTVLGGIPWRTGGNAKLLLAQKSRSFSRLVVPRSVGDDFVIPLLREKLRFEIVVRDPMRIALSPVYYSAWQKLGGGITVVHRTEVLALAVNPTNPSGPDKDPGVFLGAFRDGIPEVPSHDVIREELAAQPRKRWFGLAGRAEP